MENYGGGMCSGGYMATGEGENWNWGGGHVWGASYDQQYDCNSWGNWEYAQQQNWDMSQGQKLDAEHAWDLPEGAQVMTDQGWTMSEGPKVGAELLTELRLTELKRLIDRDAEALKKSTEGTPVPGLPDAASVREGEERPNVVERTAAEPIAENASVKKSASASGSGDEAVAEAGVAVDRAEVAAPAAATEDVIEKAFAQSTQEITPAQPAPQAASPPGLDAPDEQCYVSQADFFPDARKYGEMPIRAGDEIWVDSDPIDAWIYGFKRGLQPDQGWVPATYLGIDWNSDDEWEVPDAHGRMPRRQRRTRGARSSSRKASGRSEQEEWHSHGQWWSKQRHLNSQSENKEPQPKAAARRGNRGHSQDARHVDAENDAHAGKSAGKGKDGKSKGKGKDAAPEVERPAMREKPKRERAALTALMDRLNKPLVAPKKSEES